MKTITFLALILAGLVVAFAVHRFGARDAVAGGLTAFPLIGLWASYKFYHWHKVHRSRFLWGLYIASLVSNFASVIVAGIAVARLVTPRDVALPMVASLLLGLALFLLEAVFVFLVLRWRDLDVSTTEVDGETQNQREDRQFGEQRRDLEDVHNEERGTP